MRAEWGVSGKKSVEDRLKYLETESEILSGISKKAYDRLFQIVNSGDKESVKTNRIKQILVIEEGLLVDHNISGKLEEMVEVNKRGEERVWKIGITNLVKK